MEKVVYTIVYSSFDSYDDDHYVDTFTTFDEKEALERFNSDRKDAYEDCKQHCEDPYDEMSESGFRKVYRVSADGLSHCVSITKTSLVL